MNIFDEAHVRNMFKFWEEGVDKEFARLLENFGLKGLVTRTILEPRVRQLCVVSGLTVLNALPQLRVHIKAALRVGVTEVEVKEAIIQMTPYCGVPYVRQAFDVFIDVAQELKSEGGKEVK